MPRTMQDERGTAVIEFAFVAPIFLLFVLGILFYGVYFGAVHSVQQIAAEAARASVAGTTDAERESLARARVATDVAATSFLDPVAVTVQVVQSAGSVQVTVSYDPTRLPIWVLASLIPAPGGAIRRVGVIDTGGTP